MSFKNHAFYDKIMLGKPVAVKSFTFIPIVGITIECFGKFGIFLSGSISPKAFIIIDSIGEVSFYQISSDITPSKLLESITLLSDEE
ncbi:MAG: hypothetical protein GX892_12630 [Thermoanaerobacteraceae bacterium]|nr:hypothetical protein [Thermoanaerobacteraceae bacterium]